MCVRKREQKLLFRNSTVILNWNVEGKIGLSYGFSTNEPEWFSNTHLTDCRKKKRSNCTKLIPFMKRNSEIKHRSKLSSVANESSSTNRWVRRFIYLFSFFKDYVLLSPYLGARCTFPTPLNSLLWSSCISLYVLLHFMILVEHSAVVKCRFQFNLFNLSVILSKHKNLYMWGNSVKIFDHTLFW